MSVAIKYYVHSTTSDNIKGIAAGWNDVCLSDIGIQQAGESSSETKGLNYDVIICSDLKRAKQTAKIFFDLKENDIIYDSRLRECNYGKLNGAKRRQVNYTEHIEDAFEDGESLKDVEMRIKNLLDEIRTKYPNKNIALVGHRATQLALEVILNNKSWQEVIETDWRECGNWQLGWDYTID